MINPCQHGLPCYVSDFELYWAMRFTLHHDRMIARCMMLRPCAMSLTFKLSMSQPRSLLSIAKLNRARFLTFSVIWRRVRIANISFNFSGVFWPTSLPLF